MNDLSPRVWLLVAFSLLVLLLAHIPARLAHFVVPDTLTLEGVEGTVWRGSAARASLALADQVFMLGHVEWTIDPWTFLIARPTSHIHARWGSQVMSASVDVDWRGVIQLRDVEAVVGVDWVRQQLPLFVEGSLRLDAKQLRLSGGRLVAAHGRAVWQRAGWAAKGGSMPLGNYAVEFTGTDGTINGEVITLNGGLLAEGALVLDASNYDLELRLSGPAMGNVGLQQSIALFAVPDGDAYVVDLSGTL